MLKRSIFILSVYATAPSARMVALLGQAGHGKASLMHWWVNSCHWRHFSELWSFSQAAVAQVHPQCHSNICDCCSLRWIQRRRQLGEHTTLGHRAGQDWWVWIHGTGSTWFNIIRCGSTCADIVQISMLRIVTPKGVLRLAKCHASATREGLWASSREHLPRQKLMWQASLQLETYQLSHW